MNYCKAVFQLLTVFIIRAVLVIAGLFTVAVALPFRGPAYSVSDGRTISNLPDWVYIWGNDYDGLLGDKRLWWAANTPFQLPVDSFISMYTWAAIRNPANNMRQFSMFQAPVTGSIITYKGNYIVEDDAENAGWQFVKTTNQGKSWYGFYFVHQYKRFPSKAFIFRIGFKVKPSHQGKVDMPKGFVSKISFWKEL